MRLGFASSMLSAMLVSALAAAQPQPAPSTTAPAPAAPPQAAATSTTPAQPVAPAATAQAAPFAAPAAAPQPPAPLAQTDVVAWQRAYVQARDRLVGGEFTIAASLLDDLARKAPNPGYQLLALEQSRLAREWATRDVTLVRRADLGESAIGAKAADRATSDELAVLYTDSVLFGLGTGGWISVLTEAESAAGVILPVLVLGAGSAGVVAAIDHTRPFRYGVPQSIVTGMLLGFEEGMLWTYWNQARVRWDEEWEPKTMTSVIWGFTAAGALTGGIVGTAGGTTPGRASFVGSTSLWSAAVTGLLTTAATDLDDNSADDTILLASIIGLNAGAVGGMLGAGSVSPTIARVRYLDLGGISGGILFGGLYVAAQGDSTDGRSAVAITATGMVAGLGTAWLLTSGMPKDHRVEKTTAAPVSWAPTILPLRSGAGLGVQGIF